MREEHQEHKRTSGFSRIIGKDPESRERSYQKLQEAFEDQPITKLEREKTREEENITRALCEKMPEFVDRYHGQPIPVEPMHVHLFDDAKMTEKLREHLDEGASYWPELQMIYVLPKAQRNPLRFAQTVTHELLHFNAFASATNVEEKLRLRRGGLRVYARNGNILLEKLDEAVIEELASRFDREHFHSIPELASELDKRNAAIQNFFPENREKNADEIAYVTTEQLPNGDFDTEIIGRPYREPRERLREIMVEVQQTQPERFASPEDVFDLFARSVFTGDLLKLARTIEATYGKGSFRKLAEEIQK